MKTYLVISIVCISIISITTNSYNNQKEQYIKIIELQDSIINLTNKHCEENHDCDLPVMDGDLYDEVETIKKQVNL